MRVVGGMGTQDYDYRNKAREGCALYGKTERPLSQRCLDQYCIRKELLFACVDTAGTSQPQSQPAAEPKRPLAPGESTITF